MSDVRINNFNTPSEALVSAVGTTVTLDPVVPMVAQPLTATVSPVREGEVDRLDAPANRTLLVDLVWTGNTIVDDALADEQIAVDSNLPPHNEEIEQEVGAKGNRLAANGLELDYDVPGMDVDGLCVSFSDDDIEEETIKWANSLVIYILGVEHTMNYMQQFIDKAWKDLAVPVLHRFDNGFFVAKFDSVEDRDLGLDNGPYTIKNQPLVMKQWTVDFDFTQENLNKVPIWIKNPKLPLQF